MRLKIEIDRTTRVVAMFTLIGLVAAGCGGGGDDLSTGRVSGKVTRDGQAVSGGSVSFAPVSSGAAGGLAGKPASAVVGSDGQFTLSTYGDGDGAVIGKHKVSYSAPAVEIDEAQHKEDSPPPKNPLEGLVPKTPEVEVKSGSNTIDIELIPNPNAAGAARDRPGRQRSWALDFSRSEFV